ncbi:MAG: class II fructose-bisphosphatase [Candidatus Diapherotrites archaeon]|nr:class II fructose-bisphosphatase [Candidatus Diapherotrites archaeon]
MLLKDSLAFEILKGTEQAALACVPWIGKKDKNSADQAAVEAMRLEFNKIEMQGTIVIGEGERDQAPMLFIGEKVGTGKGIEVDFAVDPLECTNSVANNVPNAIAVLALAPSKTLLHAPDCYMNKIAVGPKCKGKVNLDWSVQKNIQIVAECLNKKVSEVTVIVLDRPRHEQLIKEVKETGAQIKLIADGDLPAAIATCLEGTGIDLLLGIGAAPEGVISAVALKCLGGYMEGRLVFTDEKQAARAKEMGVLDLNKKYLIQDLSKGSEGMFVATGIQSGVLLKGAEVSSEKIKLHSLILNAETKSVRYINSIYLK